MVSSNTYEATLCGEGVTGSNVTLLSYNATCTGFGPETRISGDGTYNGTGLFVGVSVHHFSYLYLVSHSSVM